VLGFRCWGLGTGKLGKVYMSKNNEMRKVRRLEARKGVANRTALNVFLWMQLLPLRSRLKLAWLLMSRGDLRYFARKSGKSLGQYVADRKKEIGGGVC
jgi:hypothetical protein